MTPRNWAKKIVEVLQREGHEALFAGGCVRDSILGIDPKDYDVATSATPDQVQKIFGAGKTLAIGKSFGVITVIGSHSSGHIEVATFRRDGGYSDGRRPDSVEFTNAEEDARRRDFTINGMFYDPVKEEVIDFVGGKSDLESKVVRAIGVAEERIEEDKLRMLRGVRFASTYGFELEMETKEAIRRQAHEINVVSPERIGAELRRMIGHHRSQQAMQLLLATELWHEILPNPEELQPYDWSLNLQLLSNLDSDFETNLAASLYKTGFSALQIRNAWRLKNDEVARTDWILQQTPLLSRAIELKWSQLQPVLNSPHAVFAVRLLESIEATEHCPVLGESIAKCREKLALPSEQLNPPPLIDGSSLKTLGVTPGPQFREILGEVRRRQLDQLIMDQDSALEWVRNYLRADSA